MKLRDADSIMVPFGKFLFKYRDALFPITLAGIALAARPVAFLGDPALDPVLDAAGIAVACAGQALRVITIGFAYVKRGGKDKHVYADHLVQDGVFAHSRNPMYVGNLLVIAGFALIHNSPWFYGVGLPFFLFAYLCIVAAEEAFLRTEFGETFDAYCNRVNRFLPSLRGISHTLGAMTFDWRRVVRKEYGTLFTFLTCLLGLLALEWLSFAGYEPSKARLAILGAFWAAGLCAWATARIMKKKRLLGSD